jgi:charged multivesicular body protein 3
LSREEKQAQKQVREAAKRGDVASARLLAKELVRTRKATTQLYTNKAHMIAMGTQLQEQLAMVKVRGCLLGCCNIGLGQGQS